MGTNNPLFSALESLFEEEGAGPSLDHQPLTIRTVIRLMESGSPGSGLAPRLLQMRDRVEAAARETEADIQADGDEEIQGYLHEMVMAYDDMSASLLAAAVGVEVSDVEEVSAQSRSLQALLDRLAHWDNAVREWTARPVLRCQRCGRAGEDGNLCSHCGLEVLYSDPRPVPRTTRTIQLGPEYAATYEAWNAAASGAGTLSSLWPPLDSLQALLRSYLRMSQHELALGTAGDKTTQTLIHIALASQQSLEGIARMRSAATSRRLQELNEGWALVFENAIQIQDSIPELARIVGGKSSASPVDEQDSLLIDFD